MGTVPYGEGLELQRILVDARRAGEVPDLLLLLEHPHVITLGSGAGPDNVLASARERRRLGIDLYETGRGGNVTYHGPGQLVGYPILDLRPDRQDLHRYLRDIEETLIRGLSALGVPSRRLDGLTGVWTDSGKIAAIGVRVSSGWITSHGFALNVSTQLDYFDTIVPCGISDQSVTSIEKQLGGPVDADHVRETVVEAFAEVFGRTVIGTASGPL